MGNSRQTIVLVALAAATLAGALFGPGHGSPDPAVMFAILFASLTAGIAGFAFSAICGAILFHVIADPVRVMQLMTVCSVANQALTVWSLRRTIAWRKLARFVAGGALGIAPGAWLLVHIGRQQIGHAIGGLLLVYATNLLLGGTRAFRIDCRWADPAVGALGGAIGAMAALPSLPVTVWCQLRGLDKDQQRALVQPFVFAMQLLTLPVLTALAPGGSIGLADLFCIPAGLFGTQIGLNCAGGLSNREFAVAAAVLLLVCALSFLL